MSTSDFPSSTAHPSPDTPPDDAVYARLARDFITVIRAADEAARRVQAIGRASCRERV